MDEMLKLLLEEMRAGFKRVEREIADIRQDLKRVDSKVDEFRESQEIANKLLAGDTAGLKNQLRDLRDDLKEWRRSTDRKIERLDGVRDALDH